MQKSVKTTIVASSLLGILVIAILYCCCTFYYINDYISSSIQSGLKNVVYDFVYDCRTNDSLPKRISQYSPDIVLTVYDESMRLVSDSAAGQDILELPFEPDHMQKVMSLTTSSYVYDASFYLSNGSLYYVRGSIDKMPTINLLLNYENSYSQKLVSSAQYRLLQRLSQEFKALNYDPYAAQTLTYYRNDTYLGIYDESGKRLCGMIPSKIDHILPDPTQAQSIEISGESYMIRDIEIMISGTSYFLRAASTYNLFEKTMQSLYSILLLLFILFLILLAIFGFLLLQKLMNPLEKINQSLRTIENSSDLSLRLEVSKAGDEFTRLAESCNEMLDRIEASFAREQQFSSDISHELKTPISVIMAQCESCISQYQDDPQKQSEFRVIYSKANQLNQLIEQLLAFSRMEDGRFQLTLEEIDLNIVVESVAEELVSLAEDRNVILRAEIPLEESLFKGDLSLLTSMLMNLVKNAIKYNKENGYVQLYLTKSDSRYILSVKDNGIGISEEDLPHIWERLYRADKSRHRHGGYGLGLFMVRWVVEAHNGTIHADSTLGEGTTFTIEFPINKETS